jgi:hypothetical protein
MKFLASGRSKPIYRPLARVRAHTLVRDFSLPVSGAAQPNPNCQQPIPKRQRYPGCNANSGCNVKALDHGMSPAIGPLARFLAAPEHPSGNV